MLRFLGSRAKSAATGKWETHWDALLSDLGATKANCSWEMDYNSSDVNSKFPGDAQSSYTTTRIPERRIQKSWHQSSLITVHQHYRPQIQENAWQNTKGSHAVHCSLHDTGHGYALPPAFESSVALAAVISLMVSITFQQKENLMYRLGI